MAKNKKRRHKTTPQAEPLSPRAILAKQPAEIYITSKAYRVAEKLDISMGLLKTAIEKIHTSEGRRFHGSLKGVSDVYYIKIPRSGLGQQDTRSAIATKKHNKYFILGFWEKAKHDYLTDATLARYNTVASALLCRNQQELDRYLQIGDIKDINDLL